MTKLTSAVNIDLYQATMLLGYFRSGKNGIMASMEAFTRKLPPQRNFMIACGTERIMEYIHNLKFSTDDIKLLKDLLNPHLLQEFTEADGNYLAGLNFARDLKVRAMRDGDFLFANEPVISITGPIEMVQYVEKMVLGMLNHDIRIASKAARIVIAAKNTPVIEMGGRRAHEASTADAARACYIAGFSSSSSVEAYAKYGIPCVGTMGHVWIMSHLGDEKRKAETTAFCNWSKIYKDSTYLVDTYDPYDGIQDAIHCARANIGGIRLDSGDLTMLAATGKRMLHKADGCNKAKVVATNDLNEYKIAAMINEGAYIDVYGVGTEAVCTPDAPSCNFVYKLVSIQDNNGKWNDVAKFSDGGKATLPCQKQVRRHYDPYSSIFTHDEIQNVNVQPVSHSEDLLKERNVANWTNEEYTAQMAKKLCADRIKMMPAYLKLINENNNSVHNYTVHISDELLKTQKALKDRK